jgi:hypothetical protein
MDNINHPTWYTQHPSGIECIEITKHMDFCIGNAFKYLWRCGLKVKESENAIDKEIEDLKKAIFYINRKIEILENDKKVASLKLDMQELQDLLESM